MEVERMDGGGGGGVWNGAVASCSCRFGGGGLWQGMRAGQGRPGHLVPGHLGAWARGHAAVLAQAREEAAAVVTVRLAG